MIRRRFSSEDVRPGERIDAWRAWLGEEFQPVVIDPCTADDFFVDCEVKSVGDIDITLFAGSAQSFVRPQTPQRDSSDSYVVVLMDGSIGAFEHNGHNSTCGKGDVVLLDATQPYSLVHGLCHQVLSVTIPRKLLDSFLACAAAISGLKIEGKQASAHIIQDYLRSLVRNSEMLETDTAHRMSLTAVDLIATGFAEKLALEMPTWDNHSAKIIQACTFIDENLADTKLNLPIIAAALKISTRRLQKIFSAEGLSVAECIWERRLLRAHKLLISDERGLSSIGHISSRVGFASAAHFARRFKAKFGYTPSEHQNHARKQPKSLLGK